MLYHRSYLVFCSIVAILSLIEISKAKELNSERKPRELAFQPFKSSSADFELSNSFIDKYFKELKGNHDTSNGPALFPNDGPPPPRPPLIVTSRPLVEQIARSELNPQSRDDPNAKISKKQPLLYEILLNRFGNNPSQVENDLGRHPYAEVLKKSKDSLRGTQNNKYDSVEEPTSLPPIFKALGNFARNKLQKQKPNLQKYEEYSDEYEDGENLEVRNPEKKISTIPRNIHSEQNSHFDKSQEYAFSYSVKDDHTGDDFSHKQSSSGQATNGEYRVRLPDGRMQVVTFTADEEGYKADVRYDDAQLLTGDDQKVQNIQSNRLDYEERTVKPIAESKEYEQIQSSKEYYEDYGVDYGNGRPNNFGVINDAENKQFKLSKTIFPINKNDENKFQIVRYTSTPKYAYDYDNTNKDTVEITPKPFNSRQRQELSISNRVTPNYISIINQIPYSTQQTVLEVDTTDQSINAKQYDQYIYPTTKAPPLKAVSNNFNESTRISLLDGFRNIFKSTIAPFTYKPVVNSYNNFKYNPSTILPPTATNSYNEFNYNPTTSSPNYKIINYIPSTSTPDPVNSYDTYKYSTSTPTPINFYNNYNYKSSISTTNPINSYNSKYNPLLSYAINSYSTNRYNQLTSTAKSINANNFKYNPYIITTLKPNFKLENENLKPTYNTILANKLNENNYRSNSYYANQYSPVSVLNNSGLKNENKYFNGNGVFPYASASETIALTAHSLDSKYINNATDTRDKSLKQKNTAIENLKFKDDNKNGTVLNKTGQLLPNLHHTVTPNLYSYNNYGHLDTKQY